MNMTNQAQIDDVYQQGFQAGAASRDAEIEVLQSNQANVEETHKLTLREVQRELMRLQTENDQLRARSVSKTKKVKIFGWVDVVSGKTFTAVDGWAISGDAIRYPKLDDEIEVPE